MCISGDELFVSLSCYAQAARVFESQLADSLLEGDGQLAFKKLAAATVETLMPKIETKGEFGQARWRLVSAPQVPNLLSLDPTTDPFKSLANLSFGAEVEVQLGKHLQVPSSIFTLGCRLVSMYTSVVDTVKIPPLKLDLRAVKFPGILSLTPCVKNVCWRAKGLNMLWE